MRRLARHLFTLCSAVSLLLCVAVCVLWVRSYSGEKWARGGPSAMAVVTWRGSVMFEHHARTVAPYPGITPGSSRAPKETDDGSVVSSGWQHTAVTAGQWVTSETRFGFGDVSVTNWAKNDVGKSQVYQIERGRLLVVPLWCPLFAFLVLPGLWAYWRLTNRGRLAAGLCPICGYDLRASPERCPECGAATPPVSLMS